MTVRKEPVTIENTMTMVMGELTVERAAEITGHSTGYLYSVANPNAREQLSARDLELLDLEHHASFGRGFPLYQALGRRLETAKAERFADGLAIGDHAVALAKEHGEGIAALLAAAFDSGDPARIEEALRQVEDVHRVTAETMTTLRASLARARAGPVPPDTS